MKGGKECWASRDHVKDANRTIEIVNTHGSSGKTSRVSSNSHHVSADHGGICSNLCIDIADHHSELIGVNSVGCGSSNSIRVSSNAHCVSSGLCSVSCDCCHIITDHHVKDSDVTLASCNTVIKTADVCVVSCNIIHVLSRLCFELSDSSFKISNVSGFFVLSLKGYKGSLSSDNSGLHGAVLLYEIADISLQLLDLAISKIEWASIIAAL